MTMGRPPTEVITLRKHFAQNDRVREMSVHSLKVHCVTWNQDGRRLASGSLDKSVSIFNLDKDRLAKDTTLRGHSDSVDQLCWHPKHPDTLATASVDRSVKLWDARQPKAVHSAATKGENINICWHPDGSTLAVGNKEDLVSFVDVATFKIRQEQQFKFEVNEMSWDKTGHFFFLTSGLGCIHVFSYPEMTTMQVLQAHPSNCICIEFDPCGRYFATGSSDALVSLWDVNELLCVRTFTRLDWPVRTLSFSHDGKMIASASEDLVIDIAHVETGEMVYQIPVKASAFSVAWHPKRHLLAFACDDKYPVSEDRERDAGLVKLFGLSRE
ncbi:THO complex subunit 3-like [Tropilaelaps mercedesae]|uniref:THO complex subunit 3-like n=1 Tax=Tropilaelaps mercedesae TaxID=418985 RepID=A0A1V9Y2H6_9ACAR|nr:THO complex subunit 3-like [Tropilaelaps mercedesae]